MSAYFADSQVNETNGVTKVYAIDNDETKQERYFCRQCGTTLYWKIYRLHGAPDMSDMIGIAGGCFVDSPLTTPTITANNRGKCAWLELAEMRSVELT